MQFFHVENELLFSRKNLNLFKLIKIIILREKNIYKCAITHINMQSQCD